MTVEFFITGRIEGQKEDTQEMKETKDSYKIYTGEFIQSE